MRCERKPYTQLPGGVAKGKGHSSHSLSLLPAGWNVEMMVCDGGHEQEGSTHPRESSTTEGRSRFADDVTDQC